MEIKKQKEEYRLDAGMEYDPSNVDFSKWLATKFSNYMTMDWIKTDIFQFKTPLCEAFKEFNYLLKIDVDIIDPRWNLVMILNMFASRFASRMDMLGGPLAIGKWKNIAMMAILEESMNMQEESSDNVRTHYSPSDKWEDFEHASHLEPMLQSAVDIAVIDELVIGYTLRVEQFLNPFELQDLPVLAFRL
ncbi:hypothetical protein Tco_0496657 [Tanacetum coccineum]